MGSECHAGSRIVSEAPGALLRGANYGRLRASGLATRCDVAAALAVAQGDAGRGNIFR